MYCTSKVLALAGLLSLACSGGPATAPSEPTASPPSAPPASLATGSAPTGQAAPGPDSPIPYFTNALPDSALQGRTLRELTLMRNTIYARAGNPFRKRWLNEHFSAQPWYQARATMDEGALTPIDRANAEKIAAYEASLLQSELRTRAQEVSARLAAQLNSAPPNSAPPNSALRDQVEKDLIELMLLDRSIGVVFPGDAGLQIPSWFTEKVDVTALDDASRLDSLLTVDALRDFSKRDLRILRNTVYARRGRAFKSQLLAEYFSRMEWYQPDSTYTDSRLSDIDQRNIKIIRSVEDSVGGPLTDLQQQASDEWFSGA